MVAAWRELTRRHLGLLIAGVALLALPAVVGAHHSFSSEYDGTKTFKITGAVSKVEWTNRLPRSPYPIRFIQNSTHKKLTQVFISSS